MADDKDKTELLSPEGDKDVGFEIFGLLEASLGDKQARSLPEKWNRFYELGINKHWRNTNQKIALLTANLLFTHRQRTVNMLTDNNPTFNIARLSDEITDDQYQMFQKTAEYWWREQEQQHILEESVMNGETYGCAIEKVIFNPEQELGLGEVETVVVDPFNFSVIPPAERVIQKAEAALHFISMPIRQARRRWPEHADAIKPDDNILKNIGDNRDEVARGRNSLFRGFATTYRNAIKLVRSTWGTSSSTSGDEVLVVECWSKDRSQKDSGEVDANGKSIKVAKYTGNIRTTWVCNGGEIVLEDRSNASLNPAKPIDEVKKTYLYDKFPFSRTWSVTDTTNPWGLSDFQQLERLQVEINKTISQLSMVKDRQARTTLINPKDSGVNNADFFNVPGIIQPTSAQQAAGIKYLDPPKIPTDLIAAKDIFKDLFFLVSGSFELEQAQTPGREVVAYKAIATLIEHASTMMRGKIRNYSKMIRERGRMFHALAQNWYTEDRYISFTEDGLERTLKVGTGKLLIPARLTVISGSTMPRSETQRRDESIGLFRDKAIDNEALLKNIDFPDWKEIVDRMNAGPLGQFFNRLAALEFPDFVIQYFQHLTGIDQREFEKKLEQAEIDDFGDMLENVALSQAGSGPIPPSQEEQDKQADIDLKKAQADKEQAETALVIAKINTELTEQMVKKAGVAFDNRKLEMDSERLFAEIKDRAVDRKISLAQAAAEIFSKQKLTDDAPGASKATPAKEPTKSSDKREQGPFIEKGLKSNNREE